MTYEDSEEADYSVDESNPALAAFDSKGHANIVLPDRKIEAAAHVLVSSDQSAFHVEVTRTVSSDGQVLRTRTWREDIPRDLQ